jgi:hypothetical protein
MRSFLAALAVLLAAILLSRAALAQAWPSRPVRLHPALRRMAEAGAPGYEVAGWNGIVAVAGTRRPGQPRGRRDGRAHSRQLPVAQARAHSRLARLCRRSCSRIVVSPGMTGQRLGRCGFSAERVPIHAPRGDHHRGQ